MPRATASSVSWQASSASSRCGRNRAHNLSTSGRTAVSNASSAVESPPDAARASRSRSTPSVDTRRSLHELPPGKPRAKAGSESRLVDSLPAERLSGTAYLMTTTARERVSASPWVVENVTVPVFTKRHSRTAASYKQETLSAGLTENPSGPRFSTRNTAPTLTHIAGHGGPPSDASTV